MAIRIPGTIHGGKTCLQPVNLQDLYPTLVDLLGHHVLPHNSIDGHSLRPLLENPDFKQWAWPSITYFGQNWIGLRNEQFRYISYPDGGKELYDHRQDPWELTNLAKDSSFQTTQILFEPFFPDSMAVPIPGRWTTRIKNIEATHSMENH